MSCNWCPSAEGFRVPGWNANLNLDRREGCKVDARARKEGRDSRDQRAVVAEGLSAMQEH